ELGRDRDRRRPGRPRCDRLRRRGVPDELGPRYAAGRPAATPNLPGTGARDAAPVEQGTRLARIRRHDRMKTVSEVAAWLEQFAPSHLAESWDNVGLLWGDPAAEVRRVMTCLTVTPETAAEAIREQVSMIISHHPVLFRAAKRIRADLAETGHLWRLARAGIAIASPHTAFDNTRDGINDILCRRLGLVEVTPLRP